MSLLSALPIPKQQLPANPTRSNFPPVAAEPNNAVAARREAPPYPRRATAGWTPKRPEDFGDGGAFPEIHVAQYPLGMGRTNQSSGKTLSVTVNADGSTNYDAVLKQGSNKNKIIHSEHTALIPKIDSLHEKAAKPDEDEVEKTTRETMAALQKVVENKIQVAQPKTLPAGTTPGAATYIKYTPSQQGPQFNSGASQRIIKLQDLPIDPLEPPKFRHKKVPRGTGSPPVPVMHSPPRAITVKDMQDWKIPPCISNWKNPKGYTIPLDKRLAADGRGLQDQTISDKFASLSEALYVAESKARESVEMRAKIQKELLAKEKAKKEQELRELAMKARMERANAGVGAGGRGGEAGPGETREDKEERIKRDELREERRRERERERRLEAKDAGAPGKRSKITRDRERDISEKVALGQAYAGNTGEVMYDSRLFNQDTAYNPNFGNEESYNLYDKPLFTDRSALNRAHRAPAEDEEDGGHSRGGDKEIRTDRFKADKGFQGTEGAGAGGGRDGRPVEFEQMQSDPFGLDQFLTEVRTGKKKNH